GLHPSCNFYQELKREEDACRTRLREERRQEPRGRGGVCVCWLYMCVCDGYECVCAGYECVCAGYECVCAGHECVCAGYECVCAGYECVCVCVCVCRRALTHCVANPLSSGLIWDCILA